MDYPSTETCRTERDGQILIVTICRPDKANALTPVEHQCLHEIWQRFEQDKTLRVGIISGEGERFFSAGNDLAYALANDTFPMPDTGMAGLTSWFEREKPIIAAVNGIAAGGGFEIALACDLIVADERAKFSLPEAKAGTYAGAGGLLRLPRRVGENIALELILTGTAMPVARAYELGLVNQIARSGSAKSAALEVAARVLESSPQSIAMSKRIINQTREINSMAAAQKISDKWGKALLSTDEAKEGFTAFVEKRKPDWNKF